MSEPIGPILELEYLKHRSKVGVSMSKDRRSFIFTNDKGKCLGTYTPPYKIQSELLLSALASRMN